MTNFYKEVNKIILIFQTFSLAPMADNVEWHRLLLQFYSFITFLLLLAIFSTALFLTGIVDQNMKSQTIGAVVFFVQLTTHMIIVIQSYYTREKHLAIFQRITQIDDDFSIKLGTNIDYANMRKKYYRKIGIYIVVMIGTIGLLIIHQFREQEAFSILFLLQICYPKIVLRVSCIQVLFYIDVVRDRLDMIAEWLRCPTKFSISKIEQTNLNNVEYSEIQLLKQLYGQVWEIGCVVNKCFGWSLLVIVAQHFIQSTIYGYLIFLAIDGAISITDAIPAILNGIAVAVILWALCSSAEKCLESVGFFFLFIIFSMAIFNKYLICIRHRILMKFYKQLKEIKIWTHSIRSYKNFHCKLTMNQWQ